VTTYENGLSVLWSVLVSDGDTAQAAEAAEALGALPEAQVDDSHDPEYFAMLALSVLAYALEASRAEGPEPAEWASGALLNLTADIDQIIARGTAAEVIDPRNPPPPREFEAQDAAFQTETIRTLQSDPALPRALIAALRAAARRAALDLEPAVVRFQQGMGWTEQP
jgi:hypothetical protein